MLDKLLDDIFLKVISLVLAVFIWLYLKNLISTTYEFYLPLNYRGLSQDKVIVNQNELPNYILVKIKGNKEDVSKILNIPKNSIYAFVDLSVISPKSTYQVKLVLPEEIKRLEVSIFPEEIFIDLDMIVETNLPIVILNSDRYQTFPKEVRVKTLSRNVPKLSAIELLVDTNKSYDRIILEGDNFTVFYPQVIFVSNIGIR
ncbi:MAG: hypothetical protein N2712_04300 [Brevinematales bacterium]|nr:hypothetical protein [Brevinematales bacterium]